MFPLTRFLILALFVFISGCGGGGSGSDAPSTGENPSPPTSGQLSASVEQIFGADPTVADTDNDGLTDEFEITYGFPQLKPDALDSNGDGINDGDEDTDGDGLSNLQEQANQTKKRDTHLLEKETVRDSGHPLVRSK